MAIKTELQQTAKETDGTITAYINFVDDTAGDRLKQVCIQGKTQADFEARLREYWAKVKAETAAQTTDADLVRQAMAQVETEETEKL